MISPLYRDRVASPRKSEKTRQAILDSAEEFLWSHPFRDLTVGQVTSLAGTGRSAFYQYFSDLYDLMETLLGVTSSDIYDVARPWFEVDDESVLRLEETLGGLVTVCYRRGPILRAIADAAVADARLEAAWAGFLKDFEEAIAERIEQQQALGLIPQFAARPVAASLNRLNAAMMIAQFGRRPRGNPQDVREALVRIWVSTLYGADALPSSAE